MEFLSGVSGKDFVEPGFAWDLVFAGQNFDDVTLLEFVV